MTQKRLVCLKTFDAWAEAELYRDVLRARHIHAELAGPDSSSTFGSYFGPLSRVSVMVTEETARRLATLGEETLLAGPVSGRQGCHSLQPYTPTRLPAARRVRSDKLPD